MKPLEYRLVVVTDGRPGLLERTLGSFEVSVRPRPTEVVVVDDSGDPTYRAYLADLFHRFYDIAPTVIVSHRDRLGFCATVADAWRLAAQPGPPLILWQEDDFVYRRHVDLTLLAQVLAAEPLLAQMALYRDPVSPEEKVAGGYINMRPETYERRGTGAMVWQRHTNFWTTNVSLFRRDVAVGQPWPVVPFCEGEFGFQLRAALPETFFGIWGAGDPWIEHIGARGGTGY